MTAHYEMPTSSARAISTPSAAVARALRRGCRTNGRRGRWIAF